MEQSFLGIGWSLRPNEQGRVVGISRATGEQAVRQSIEVILQTAKGERVMRPDFGCSIHDFVFAVNNAATRSRVADTVRQDLIRWEPRIDVLAVTAETNMEKPTELLVQINYRVRSTNNVFNLVYPFYLEERNLS